MQFFPCQVSIILENYWKVKKAEKQSSEICFSELGQIKNNVFRVTRPYLNLLVKPRIFSCFLEKYIILCILKGEMPFKMHKIVYFFRKKNN